ncbi:MAG: methyl-accepting chemotaxis protein [Nitrospirae bacterium]|nr:methyl-accepting chemotaxis protein [Nitrospirota bacterium]
MRTYKRRQYIVDRSYQGRVIAKIVMICSLGMMLELVMFNYLSYGNIESLRWRVHISAETISEIVRSYLISSSAVGISVTAIALYLFLQGILQRTAGPIYRLKKDIEIASSGDLSLSIWLSREDDFKDTAVELNRMIEAMRADFTLMRKGFSDVTRTVDLLEYVADKPEIAIAKCQRLIDTLEPLKEIKK